ncbi:hypothetical protein [Paenibacillus sp. 32352]|uniref:hypothetical protein n=1 Tax=Paenibacillus sp. 32352 TaxID=1969111 RepID=UPI0009ABCDC6|nr:hypothetical protein [Paenibacillus sp. 32352]
MISTELTRQKLLQWLEHNEANYNPELQLLRQPFSSPGYHTTLRDVPYVHPTRESLSYAVTLLGSGIPRYQERGCAIVEKVLSLQDTDPSRPTHGIWSWFYEEPLDQMAPPDWNWADFCGKQLVLAAMHYQDIMSSGLKSCLRDAIFRACQAIIARNVRPGYTNISIMGSFVTLLAGEVYDYPPYRDYGLQRLTEFHAHTKRLGTFEEYNSPTYTTVAIAELSSLYTRTKNEAARQLTEELLEVGWRMVAEHFHVPTKQWAGPHSRSYDKLLAPKFLTFLQLGLEGEVRFLPDEDLIFEPNWYDSGLCCPDKLRRYFIEPHHEHLRQRIYENTGKRIQKHATLFMNEAYALGTIDKEIMWNQRRNLLAYMKHGGETAYMQLQCLHDGYDYAAAIITSRQNEGDVLYGIGFSTNGGDTHSSLDRIKGWVKAQDLRIRLEFGGCLDTIEVKVQEERRVRVVLGEHTICVQNLLAEFQSDSSKTGWEWQIQDGRLHLDYILYSGPEHVFNFTDMEQAGLLFALSLGDREKWLQVEVTEQEQYWTARCTDGSPSLKLAMRRKPATVDELLSQ